MSSKRATEPEACAKKIMVLGQWAGGDRERDHGPEAVGTPVQLYVQDSLKPLYLRGPRGVGVVAPVFVGS